MRTVTLSDEEIIAIVAYLDAYRLGINPGLMAGSYPPSYSAKSLADRLNSKLKEAKI